MKVAIYIRLSSADEETGFSKQESESILNQRLYINAYLDAHATLSDCIRKEFVDDGYSGAYIDRPKLNEMLNLVRSGEIQTIVVKDFSRFFRDYIEAGNYLECVFPFLGVRFISINDHYDSDDYKGSTGGLEMVVRNIVYASYSKDLSVKTTTAREHMMKQGKFVGSHAPFGYVMHHSVKNKLAIDEGSAYIVRGIFEDAMRGKNTSQIAKRLNTQNTPTPAQYFKAKYPNNKKFSFASAEISWTAAMVYLILTNERYTGTLVSGRKKKVSPTVKKYVKTVPIIVENTHDAIVSKQEFEQAGCVIRKAKKAQPRVQSAYALKSLVRCANCGRLMRRKLGARNRYYYECTYSRHDSATQCPVSLKVYEDELEKLVLHTINDFVLVAGEKVRSNQQSQERQAHTLQGRFETSREEIEQCKVEKLTLYERYVSGALPKEQYLQLRQAVDAKIVAAEQARLETEAKLGELSRHGEGERVTCLCDQYLNTSELTNEMAKAFVERVLIMGKDAIEIKMRFADVYI